MGKDVHVSMAWEGVGYIVFVSFFNPSVYVYVVLHGSMYPLATIPVSDKRRFYLVSLNMIDSFFDTIQFHTTSYFRFLNITLANPSGYVLATEQCPVYLK